MKEKITGYTKYLKTDEVRISEPFSSIFLVKQEVLTAITENMREHGYDTSCPIIIWKEKDILIDGHTRLEAAKEAGIKEIPVFYASFDAEDDVIDYMNHTQFSRRNIDDAELIKLLIKALPKYEKKYGEGSKAEFLSNRFTGLSEAKAKQAIVVIEKGCQKDIDAIIAEETSIKAVYDKMRNNGQSSPKSNIDKQEIPSRGIISCNDKGTFFITDETNGQKFKLMKIHKELNIEAVKEKIKNIFQEEINNQG